VILADLEDLSYKEIADIMECPAGTVMSRLYRGRKMLQKQLADYARIPETQQTTSEPASKSKSRGEPASSASAARGVPSEVVDLQSFRLKKQEGGAA
jgi:RNA polymerase sigma-70 factor (ECF subfamily)